jgi:uncharacterized membrane protein
MSSAAESTRGSGSGPVSRPWTRLRTTAATLVLERPWPLVVWAAMVGWSAILFTLARSKFLEFRFGRFDLGSIVQAISNTAHGRPLEATDAVGDQVLRLGSHVEPILVLLAPIWMIAPSPLTLAAVQIGACALGALPVFWLARRHLDSERAAAMLALAYLAYPWLAWTALDAIHPVTFAIPLVLLGVWFLDTQRPLPFAVCAVLIAATGELMGLPLAVLGVWYALARKHRIAGLAIAGAGLAWTALALEVILPASREGGSVFYAYYESIGGTPTGIARTLVTDPGAILSEATSQYDLAYLFWLGAPLAGVFLFAPGLAAAAIPQLAVNMLSSRGTFVDPRAHYIGAVIPFLLAASILGLGRIPAERRVRAAAVVLGFSAAMSFVFGPWPGWPSAQPTGPSRYAQVYPAQRTEALHAAVELVPDGVPVSATNAVGSHLSARRYFYSVPIVERARWIVVDTSDPALPAIPIGYRSPERLRSFVRAIRKNPRWQQVFDRGGVLVFRKASDE